MSSRWRGTDYGKSSYTPMKQQHLREIATMVMCAAREAMGKHPDWATAPFLLADLFAGPGVDDDGDTGSPLILLDAATAHLAAVECWLFENHALRGSRLEMTVYGMPGPAQVRPIVFVADCQGAFPPAMADMIRRHRASKVYGLLYADPTGEMPWTLIADAAARLPRVDILLSLQATTVKRLHGVWPESKPSLEAALGGIAKTHWLVRELHGPYQWTFLLGTNYPGYARWGMKRIGLVPVDSADGQRIIERAYLTADELAARAQMARDAAQLSLF